MMLVAFLGATLRWLGLLGRTHVERIVQILFRISLPATIMVSVDRLVFDPALWRLPIAAALIILSLLPCAWLLGKWLHLPLPSRGTLMVGTSIMNLAFFGYAVMLGLFGHAGLARAVLFDVGHGLVVFTLVYGVAVACGSRTASRRDALKRFLCSPPLWAICGICLLRAAGLQLPEPVHALLTPIHLTTMPLASLVLGLSIDVSAIARQSLVAGAAVLLRMAGGGTIGWMWATALGLSDLDRAVVAMSAAMPVGVNTLVFAAEQELDEGLAATMIALSIAVGLVCLPLLPWLVPFWRQ
jgi:predicted permease